MSATRGWILTLVGLSVGTSGCTRATAAADTESARDKRLAMQGTALAAAVARCDAFGHVDAFATALQRMRQERPEPIDGREAWAQVARGWLPLMAIDHWVEWHLPAADRTLPRAVDFEGAGIHPFATIVDMATQLAKHDIDFALVIFPSRLQLYPELVLPELEGKLGVGFGGMVHATAKFLCALNAAGVEVIDLAPTFIAARAAPTPEDGELYLLRNKHWTPRGAELAAREVSDFVRALPWFEPGPLFEGKEFEITRRVVGIGGTEGGQAPDATPEKLALHQVRQRGAPVNPSLTRRSPIVVLGDSFLKFYFDQNAGFVDHLRRFTGHPIDAIMPMGGAESQCRDQLARRGDNLRGKKLVLWLMQEDNLKVSPEFRKIPLFEE